MERGLSDTIVYPFRNHAYPSILLSLVFGVGVLFSLAGMMNGYGLKLMVAFGLLYFLIQRFFTQNFTIVVFVALLYQWMQVTIKVFDGFFNDVPFESLTKYPEYFHEAYYVGIFALWSFAYGIAWQLKKFQYSTVVFEQELLELKPLPMLLGYLGFGVLINALFALRFVVPGLFQAIALLTNFKWSLFFILFFVVHVHRKYVMVFWAIVLFEFVGSFFSFFASFKAIIFFLLIAYMSFSIISWRKLIYVGIASVGVYFVAIFWTSVKGEYRSFLNQGTRTQAVRVEKDEALDFLGDKLFQFSLEESEETQKDFVDRMSYIDYLSACMNYVPSRLPHENGGIIKNSIMHILLPRILNPNKAAIDDSNHLNYYTGLDFANAQKGVSFSLGYVGDFYIDFGTYFMMIPLFFFGIFVGWILLSIFRASPSPLLGAALITGVFDVLYKFETSQIKFLGNLIWYWIVFYFLAKYVIPRIQLFLQKQS